MQRHRILPSTGRCLVSTDLHGNKRDFVTLRTVFESLPNDAHWVLLGDFVHGPNAESRADEPHLYDYDDESGWIVEQVHLLQERHPDRVHVVLGNHDHGHVGGVHTHKFYPDEVLELERKLDKNALDILRNLFANALLLVAAPCGVLLSHGSPDDKLQRLDELDGVALNGIGNTPHQQHLLACVLRAYGQSESRSRACLASLSSNSGLALNAVIHGHDRDENGWFYEANTQLCPVIFGAPDENKRYVLLDLAAHYPDVFALRDGIEILRLYP